MIRDFQCGLFNIVFVSLYCIRIIYRYIIKVVITCFAIYLKQIGIKNINSINNKFEQNLLSELQITTSSIGSHYIVCLLYYYIKVSNNSILILLLSLRCKHFSVNIEISFSKPASLGVYGLCKTIS